MKIERRLAGFYINGQSNVEFSFDCRLLLRDPVRSYVSVTRRDNTANLETKQISFRGKIQHGKDNGDVCTQQKPSLAIYTKCMHTLC